MSLKRVPFAVVVVVACAALGGLFGSRLTASEDRTTTRYRMYAAALDAVQRDYVTPVDSAAVIDSSIDGMLRTLDPHSTFFEPKQFAQMRERQEGHYYGIGVTIAQSIEGDVTITSIFEGSPAYHAGIRRGDIIARSGKRREGLHDRRGRQAHQRAQRNDRQHRHPTAGRREAHRPHGRARRDQHRHRANGVHDQAGHGLHPPSGLLRDDRSGDDGRARQAQGRPACSA